MTTLPVNTPAAAVVDVACALVSVCVFVVCVVVVVSVYVDSIVLLVGVSVLLVYGGAAKSDNQLVETDDEQW